jgi:capsular exopolysaccharide synthesis family protein
MNDRNDYIVKNGDVLRRRTHVSGRDFLTIFRYISRRTWVYVLGLLAGATIGFLWLLVTPPLYAASARLMVGNHAGFEGVLLSEVEIIRSTPVISKVAGILGLYQDPRFNKPNIIEKIVVSDNSETMQHNRVLARLSDMLEVTNIKDTSIIDITVRHPSPERAAQIANVVLSSYRERKMDERFEQSRTVSDWVGKHKRAIQEKIDASKKTLADFEMRHGLTNIDGTQGLADQVKTLSDEVTQTREQIAKLETQLAHMLKSGKAYESSQNTKTQKLLQQDLTELRKRYGEKHPKIIVQLQKIEQAKAQKISRISIEEKIKSAKARLKNLQESINDFAKNYDENAKLELTRVNLKADVNLNQRIHENFLIKYQDVSAQVELQDNTIKIVSMATIPSKPEQADRYILLGVMALLGMMVSFLAVLTRALCNTGFVNVNQLESMAGYPVFAAVPSAVQHKISMHHTVIEKPATVIAEALRSLRVALRLRSDQGRGPRVVAFTSTLPDEGKTSLAVMLGVIAAKSGERVVIVDCDLRRPSLHKAFGIGNAKGLQDYLGNTSGVEDVIYRKDPSGVHLVTTKAVPSYALTLLTSGRMEGFIENLREKYDLVILDAPSSLAFADARVLARMVDQTLYVVAWNATRRDSTLASLKAYADMGYHDLALILNKVDLREYLRDSVSTVVYQYGRDDAELAALKAA